MAPAARRAGLSFRALAEPDDEDAGRFREGQAGLSATQAMGRALSELYVRLNAGAALDDMLAAIEEWRPDVVVRESAEFSSLLRSASVFGMRPGLDRAVLELLSVPRYRDRARAIADEIQTLPPIDEAPNALSALAQSPARVA